MKHRMMTATIRSFIIVSGLCFARPYAVSAEREAGTAGGWPELKARQNDAQTGQVKEKAMMVSWGDLIVFYGPDTDPGLTTPQQIKNMMAYWKRQGFTQIYWRGEDLRDSRFKWNESTIYAEGSWIRSESERIKKEFDTTACAIQAARDEGIELFFWQSIFDDGTPPDKIHRKWSQGFPWRNTFFDEHPGLEVVDRRGNIQWGVRELAYPLARQQKIEDYVKLLKRYDLDGVLLYLHTHSDPGDHGDQYGFNAPIVEEYRRRYGIDILTDPRFDYLNPEFNPADPDVEAWRQLRGEYLTQFIREIKAALKAIKPDIKIAINTQGGDYFGPPFGNMKIDWRTWIQEGLIDILIIRTWMAGGCGAYDFSKEGYLTWGDAETGVTPYAQIRKVIADSGHDVQLISRSRTYIPGVDGYFDATNRDNSYPKTQRLEQLKENKIRDGHIVFIHQDFDTSTPLDDKGFLDCTFGGKRYFIGDFRYSASTNFSPGFAGPLTDRMDQSPALVSAAPTDRQDMAVGLKASAPAFQIIRRTGRDWPDEPISAGRAVVEFDVYVSEVGSMLQITPILDRKITPKNLQLKIDDNGRLWILKGDKPSQTELIFPAQKWSSVNLTLDYDKTIYSIGISTQPDSAVAGAFEAGEEIFDGLNFECRTGQVYIDNIKITLY